MSAILVNEQQPLSPDLGEAQRFLSIFGDDITFQTFDDDSELKRRELSRVLHGALSEHGPDLLRLNAAGAGVFFMVNEGDGKGRKAANVEDVRALYVDLDGTPLEPVENAAAKPHVTVESSSGRYHAYWLVEDCPLDRFSHLQKALIAKFKSDKAVHDLPRVLRVPGFIWHKPDKGVPFRTRILTTNDAPRYRLNEFEAAMGFADASNDDAAALDWMMGLSDVAPDSLVTKPAQRSSAADVRTHEVVIDKVRAHRRFAEYLEAAAVAVQGEHGDDRTVEVAREGRDFGLSEEETFDAMLDWNERCLPPWPLDDLKTKVTNGHKYAQLPAGNRAPEVDFAGVPMPALLPDPRSDAERERIRASAELAAVLEEMNKRHFVVNQAGEVLVYSPNYDETLKRECLERFTFENLRRLYQNKRLAVGYKRDGAPITKDQGTAWLDWSERRQYPGGVTFLPGQETPEGKFNLWRGWAIAPKAGDWSLLKAHIKHIICSDDETAFGYVMGWLARLVRLPGEQGEVALVLRGGKGIGKGTLANAMLRIFGQHGLTISNPEHFMGRFNGHLRDACFVFADECFFAGDKQHESTLKTFVTEPTITVEDKFARPVTVKNVSHVLMASNEQWVIPAGKDERRFAVLDVSESRKQDRGYFEPLYREMNAGGIAAMLDDLLAYDITNFDVRDYPRNDALRDQKAQSFKDVDAWLFNCLNLGQIGTRDWTDKGVDISTHDAFADYRQQAGKYPKDVRTWGSTLRDALKGCAVDKKRAGSGRNGEQRQHMLILGGLTDARASFVKVAGLGASFQWETEARASSFD